MFRGSIGFAISVITIILLILNYFRIALILYALFFLVMGLTIGYFGVIKGDLDNKYIFYLGGVTRCGGIPKTPQGIKRSGYIHAVLGIILSLSLFWFALKF